MRKMQLNRVDNALLHSHAKRLDHCELNEELSLARWSNCRAEVSYKKVGHHTLSLYLQGGFYSRRMGCPEKTGAPGKVCLMPSEHDSYWEIDGSLEFLHVYFSEKSLKQLGLSAFDMDPRLVELPDLTYVEDPGLVQLCHQKLISVDWQETANKLHLQEAAYELMAHLLKSYALYKKKDIAYRGGLSPKVKRIVEDYISANYHREIQLDELASVAELSPYHFARMFKLSFGATPHQYITELRINAAKDRIKQGESLADVATFCGFANQSHFSRAFKKTLGVTPGQFRNYY